MIEQRLQELKKIYEMGMRFAIKKGWGNRSPYDTGKMWRETNMIGISLNADTLEVKVIINSTTYSKFIINGTGTSSGYGPRDFVEKAAGFDQVSDALDNLYAAIIEEKVVEAMKGKRIRNIQYNI